MKVNGIQKVFQNKHVLKGLEKISEHGTSFVALTSFAMATTLRPIAISLTPDTEKRNKQYAVANSLSSALIKLAMVEAVALPIENAIKKIDNNPEKFLKIEVIKKLANGQNLSSSRAYRFLTQMMKLSAGLFMAVPKSILTVAIIPVFIAGNTIKNNQKSINNKDVNFTGRLSDKLPKSLSHLINNNKVQNFALRNQTNDKNLAKYMTVTTDALLTTTTAYGIDKSKKIEKNHKKFLIYNNIISTAITIVGGIFTDKFVSKKSEKVLENFKLLNKNNPKLPKYIEGINILRPTLIFAGIYYGLLPLLSTYISEKIDKYLNTPKKQTIN